MTTYLPKYVSSVDSVSVRVVLLFEKIHQKATVPIQFPRNKFWQNENKRYAGNIKKIIEETSFEMCIVLYLSWILIVLFVCSDKHIHTYAQNM